MDQERATDHAQATGRRIKGSAGGASRSSRTRLAVVVGALALLGLAAAAQPAIAANHDIHMTAPTRVPLGQSGLIRIDGVVAPPAEFWDESWIEVVALPGNLMPECPGDAQSAGSIAEESGNILAIAMRPSTDEAGNFANSVAFHGARSGAGDDLRLSLRRCRPHVGRGHVATRSRRGRWRRRSHRPRPRPRRQRRRARERAQAVGDPYGEAVGLSQGSLVKRSLLRLQLVRRRQSSA